SAYGLQIGSLYHPYCYCCFLLGWGCLSAAPGMPLTSSRGRMSLIEQALACQVFSYWMFTLKPFLPKLLVYYINI
ncbi:MAG: hypothetical protein AB1489_27340, partial [Acidobacteriota bacterium]